MAVDAAWDEPGVGGVGRHFAAQEALDPAFLKQRHLLGVAQSLFMTPEFRAALYEWEV